MFARPYLSHAFALAANRQRTTRRRYRSAFHDRAYVRNLDALGTITPPHSEKTVSCETKLAQGSIPEPALVLVTMGIDEPSASMFLSLEEFPRVNITLWVRQNTSTVPFALGSVEKRKKKKEREREKRQT